MASNDCVFCRILKGEIPAQKVFENDRVAAILDINPISWGHTLVLTKAHHETYTDLPEDALASLVQAAQQIARGILKAAGAEGFNLLMNNHRCSGQAIPHAHVHIIPRKTGDGIKFNWQTKPYAQGDLEKTADAIKKEIK